MKNFIKVSIYSVLQEKIKNNTVPSTLEIPVPGTVKNKSTTEILIREKINKIEEDKREEAKIEKNKNEEAKIEREKKKILIEEIQYFEVKIDEKKNYGSVEVNQREKNFEVVAEMPKENGMKAVEIDATQKQIKVNSPNFAFQVCFQQNIKLIDSQISAKWVKNKKKLIITCPYGN